MSRRQKIGFFAASLLPALWLLFGLIIWIPGSAVPTLSFILVNLLLPALTIVALYKVIRQNEYAADRWVFTFLTLAGALILSMCLIFRGHFSLHDHAKGQAALDLYEDDIGHYELMPESTDLGNPEQIEYHYFFNLYGIFFDSEDYAAMTAELEDRYTFHTEPLDAGETDLPPLYTLDGYEFRFLEMHTDIYRLMYPKTMILIGTNDETHEIVWSYYDDDDLDWIEDPTNFLLEDCGWKYIR